MHQSEITPWVNMSSIDVVSLMGPDWSWLSQKVQELWAVFV